MGLKETKRAEGRFEHGPPSCHLFLTDLVWLCWPGGPESGELGSFADEELFISFILLRGVLLHLGFIYLSRLGPLGCCLLFLSFRWKVSVLYIVIIFLFTYSVYLWFQQGEQDMLRHRGFHICISIGCMTWLFLNRRLVSFISLQTLDVIL